MKRDKLYKIDNARQLAEIVTPVRNQIRLAMEMLGECSINELADSLDRSAESLYYHVDKLEKVGLVVQTGNRRSASGRDEALYSLCAQRVRVNTSIRSKRFTDKLLRGVRTYFRYAERCFERSMRDSTTVLDGDLRECRVIQVTAKLSREDVIKLNRKLLEIESWLESRNAKSDERRYVATLCLSPTGPMDD